MRNPYVHWEVTHPQTNLRIVGFSPFDSNARIGWESILFSARHAPRTFLQTMIARTLSNHPKSAFQYQAVETFPNIAEALLGLRRAQSAGDSGTFFIDHLDADDQHSASTEFLQSLVDVARFRRAKASNLRIATRAAARAARLTPKVRADVNRLLLQSTAHKQIKRLYPQLLHGDLQIIKEEAARVSQRSNGRVKGQTIKHPCWFKNLSTVERGLLLIRLNNQVPYRMLAREYEVSLGAIAEASKQLRGLLRVQRQTKKPLHS